MQRTNRYQLKPTKAQAKLLNELRLLSSCVYNSANYIVRQQIFNKEEISGFYDLQKKVQTTDDYRLLGRVYALPRIQQYSETNIAIFRLIQSKSQKCVGLPNYFKNRKTNTTLPSHLMMDNNVYLISHNHISLPLSRKMHKKYGIKHFKVKYNGIAKWEGKQQRGQIHYKDGKFYLYQTVEVKNPEPMKGNVSAGIDLGIKKLMSAKISNGDDVMVGSKRHFRQWQHLTGLIAEEQESLEKIRRKSSNRLQRLYSRRSKWQDNLYNNLVCKIFRKFNANNVNRIFIGDITHILDNSDKGRLCNQMTHNYWSFGKLYKKIGNKAEEYGIDLVKVDEAYTSMTCPICGMESYPKDRIFVCDFCGNVEHRDIIGATNILNIGIVSMYGSEEKSIHRAEGCPLEVA